MSRAKLFWLSAAVLVALELLFAVTGVHKSYSRPPHHPWLTFAISTPLVLAILCVAFYVGRPRS